MKPRPATTASELRRQAEARLKDQKSAVKAQRSDAENERFLHELQVHQIELEMQNDQLRAAQTELAEAAARYADLYDFAPVGYVTLDRSGQITQANLAGARLLGTARARLTGKRFAAFVAETDRRGFDECLRQVFAGEALQTCQMVLEAIDPPRSVQIMAALSADGLECRVAVEDITERMEAEAAVQASVETQTAILDALPAHIALLDPQGHILAVNENWRRFGSGNAILSQDFDIGRNYLAVCELATGDCSSEARQVAAGLRDVLEGRQSRFEIEYPCHSPEEERWFRLMATPLNPGGGRGVVVMHIDITASKQAESQLRLFEISVAQLNDAVIITEAEPLTATGPRMVFVNDAAERMTGYTRAEPIGQTPRLFQRPSTDQGEIRRIGAALREGKSVHAELINYTKAGTEYWVEMNVAPVFSAAGVVTNFVAIERDITVRKSNELALLASENRFRQVVETIQEAFWIRDAEHGRVIYISPAYEKIWGFTCQSLYDSPTAWLEAVHPEDRERVQTEAAQQARGGYDETYRIIRPDGSLRWIHDKAFPVRDETGVVTRIVGVAEDITANQELEAQLRQAQKMEAIGTLAGGIAHDFNNILAAVNGYAELAKANSKGQPELLEDLEAVLEATCRATDLVRQIMAFSRRQNTQHGPVRLQTIVKEALRLLRATIPTTVEIKSVLKTNAPPILADATQIHQVVMNLCMNAWHAMKNRPGQLEIRVDQRVLDDEFVRVHPELKAGPHLQMSITDTGCGMNRETASRIFEPFFTTKGPNEGSGLGLAVVHGIVRSHHGAIIVRSEPNVGTTFDLYFPEYLGTEVSPLERPLGQAPQGRSEHVLFVDDDESLARLGAKVLKKFGYVVSAFSSSKEALAALRATPDDFDLVVSDLAMPEMSGLDLAREIRRLRPNLPIILTSGFVDQAVQEIIQTIGIQQVLPKPVRVETLIRTVHQVLAVESKA